MHVEATATGHGLHDERRIAWNMPAEMLSRKPRIEAISAAHAGADSDGDGPAAIELGYRIGLRWSYHGKRQCQRATDSPTSHASPPVRSSFAGRVGILRTSVKRHEP